jgi:hypothetical protein
MQSCTSFSIAVATAMTQENTCTILPFKIPLSEYRVIRGALNKVKNYENLKNDV